MEIGINTALISPFAAFLYGQNLSKTPTRLHSIYGPVKRASLNECPLNAEAAILIRLTFFLHFMFNVLVRKIPKF